MLPAEKTTRQIDCSMIKAIPIPKKAINFFTVPTRLHHARPPRRVDEAESRGKEGIEEALVLAPQGAAKVGESDLLVKDDLVGGLYGSSHRLLSKIAQICLIGRG